MSKNNSLIIILIFVSFFARTLFSYENDEIRIMIEKSNDITFSPGGYCAIPKIKPTLYVKTRGGVNELVGLGRNNILYTGKESDSEEFVFRVNNLFVPVETRKEIEKIISEKKSILIFFKKDIVYIFDFETNTFSSIRRSLN